MKRDLSKSKVTVLGAGKSGLAAARLLRKNGSEVLVSEVKDRKSCGEIPGILNRENIPAEFGGHSDKIFKSDWWVVSPGIPVYSDCIQKALSRQIAVYSEIEVASWFCRSPIIAITGSNGKSTTTALTGHLIQTSGKPCIIAGNIGQPFSDVVDKTRSDGVTVLEVSSFQLELIHDFHPRVAMFLNLSPDHLDRHGSLEVYSRMKARIYQNQTESDFTVYNGMDPMVVGLAEETRGIQIAFGLECKTTHCAYIDEGHFKLKVFDQYESIGSVQDLQIPGEHNVLNALAAVTAARLVKTEISMIEKGLKSFHGLPHRLEFIRNLDGVDWINDSKGTNVDSVWYALGSFNKPIILIAGGRDKDSNFTILKERIQQKVKAVILLGEAKDKIEKAFEGIQNIFQVSSLEESIKKARSLADSGDVIMLSPACASFDMFQNFEDRGDQFKKMVNAL